MEFRNVFTFVVSLSLLATSAFADPVSGVFKAVSACDAYKSFNKGTNPGLVRTVPGQEYQAVEINNKEMSWVRIRVPNVSEPRWVSGECGTKDFGTTPVEPDHGGGGGGACHTKNQYDSYVLAMSWQPGFCEHVPQGKTKPECEALRDGDLVIDHLTLHGLWPNKKSCGTNYDNCGGPDLNLDEGTISQLAPWMPNFYYGTDFGTHEWVTHGNCQQLADDQYFLTAVRLVQAVDKSSVGSFIKSKVGSSFSPQEFFDQIQRDYGQDVANRIMLVCAGNKYLQEVRLNLPRVLSDSDDLKKITAGGSSWSSHTSHCSDEIYVENSGTANGAHVNEE